jgi:hypothetical protein
VVDVVGTVRPEVTDRDGALPQHQVGALERPIFLGDVTHERAAPLLYHKRLADVFNDRTVESGLALGDDRARLTAYRSNLPA